MLNPKKRRSQSLDTGDSDNEYFFFDNMSVPDYAMFVLDSYYDDDSKIWSGNY